MSFPKGHLPYKGTEKTMFKKGLTPWNKGKKWDEETKKKMSLAKIGKSSWNKGLKGYMAGEKNCNWKGGHLMVDYKDCPKCGKRIKKVSSLCRSCANSGQLSHQWRGGITPINKIIRRSDQYKSWRELVFKRDNYTCQYCKIVGSNLHPHHIKSFAYYPKLRFELSNGLTLCKSCHKLTENYGNKQRSKKIGGGVSEFQII